MGMPKSLHGHDAPVHHNAAPASRTRRSSRWLFAVALLACLNVPAAAAPPVAQSSPVAPTSSDPAVRVKDLGRLHGWREHALVGYGLVTGLAGTGDSLRSRATRQSLANMLSRFDLIVPPEELNTRNVAAVMVTARLPVFARQGDTLDVTVTSAGDARSLAGGTLILAPLKGPDGQVYALAQGAVSVGGYRYDANGNLQQKNHPTVGTVAAGAWVERSLAASSPDVPALSFVLSQPDYTTATRVADGINQALGATVATVRDAAGVDIAVAPQWQAQVPRLIAQIEAMRVQPDRRARVVVNERTGTVVTGGDVRLSRVAVSHGDLRVSVVTDNTVSQPMLVRQTGADVRTEVVANSRINVQENETAVFVGPTHHTVSDLVQALSRLRTPARDVIAILQAVKAAGALHADLIVQ